MLTKELGLNRFDSLKQWLGLFFPGCNCRSACRIMAVFDNVLNQKGDKEALPLLRGYADECSPYKPDKCFKLEVKGEGRGKA